MSIQPLPGDVVNQLKSSVTVTSLGVVAVSLVQNALDAQASKINVAIDFARVTCTVEDNGTGIPPLDFREDGGLGMMHCTSKYPPASPTLHGRHGAFLASLAALSLLTITSHHREYYSHNSLTMLHGQVIARRTPAPAEHHIMLFPHGTRVTVRDLFGGMPVRVRHRAQEAQRTGFLAREVDRLVWELVGLLMAWRGEQVLLTLKDSATQKVVPLRAGRVGRQEELFCRTHSLLSRAGLHSAPLSSYIPVGASAPGVSVSGCISLTPTATRQRQFISLGIRPLGNDSGVNVLYEEVNRVFADSAFGMVDEKKGVDRWPVFYLRVELKDDTKEEDVSGAGLSVIVGLLRAVAYAFLKKHAMRPRVVDTFGVMRKRTREKVEGKEMERRTGKGPTERDASAPHGTSTKTKSDEASEGRASSVRPPSRTASPFVWQPQTKAISTATGNKTCEDSTQTERLIGASKKRPHILSANSSRTSLQKQVNEAPDRMHPQNPSPDPPRKAALPAAICRNGPPEPPEDEDDETRPPGTLCWSDPDTKTRHIVDARTGFILDTDRVKRLSLPERQLHNLPSAPPSLGFSTLDPEKAGQKHPGSSHRKTLDTTLVNLRFVPTEPPVPRVPDFFTQTCHRFSLPRGKQISLGDAFHAASAIGVEGRISRDALRRAVVVGQVDRKFVLIKTRSSNDVAEDKRPLLILVDQHAADERLRLEELMEKYFTQPTEGKIEARTEALTRILRFELAVREAELLQQYSARFKYWGIVYSVHRPSLAQLARTVAVDVHSLPPSILERCRLEPRVLVELLRKEVWRMQDDGGKREEVETEDKSWVARFHGCPMGILELLHSRSCRSEIPVLLVQVPIFAEFSWHADRVAKGAIMFNDPLTHHQCEDLLRRLTECAFPFQCAHGRPSMVPCVDLGADNDMSLEGEWGVDYDRGTGSGLARELAEWMKKDEKR